MRGTAVQRLYEAMRDGEPDTTENRRRWAETAQVKRVATILSYMLHAGYVEYDGTRIVKKIRPQSAIGTVVDRDILSQIGAGATLAEICDLTGYTPRTVTAHLDTLESSGLVAKVRDIDGNDLWRRTE